MQTRTILYQYIKTLIKHVFLLNFTYELLMSFRMVFLKPTFKNRLYVLRVSVIIYNFIFVVNETVRVNVYLGQVSGTSKDVAPKGK